MTIEKRDQKALALWAASCAVRVLQCFVGQYPEDDRPPKAVEAACAWVRGEVSVSEARTAALAAYAASRDADDLAACAAARAAGHAAATAHVASHARYAADYAVKAIEYSADATYADATKERKRQAQTLLDHLRPVVFPQD